MTESPCSRIDPEVMFPHPSDVSGIEFAKQQVCGACHVRAECLEWALNQFSRSDYGIFGGLTEDERKELVKSRQLGKAERLNYGSFPPKNKRLTAAA
ncbi:WhiB family transcriptional regulator [Streptomyces coeruleorubidus]|uniref:WhiB family transcriptional regulator n=1 Tax=Streptomyces coeruleorubidus TaxID=116188 RepID=UPI00339FB889